MSTFRAALITGSSSGIGAAFARILPAETHLVLTGRNTDRLQALSSALSRPGRDTVTVVADLATPQGRETVVDIARRRDIDLLVCCAGSAYLRKFHEAEPPGMRETVELSVVATAELLHALIAPMIATARRQRRRSGIVVVSSRAAFAPLPGLASYCAGKAFQLRLVESIAMELKREPLDVLAVCPTYTETDFFARAGLPQPLWWATPESVARQAMDALGKRSVHVCRSPHERFGLLRPSYDVLHRLWRAARYIG